MGKVPGGTPTKVTGFQTAAVCPQLKVSCDQVKPMAGNRQCERSAKYWCDLQFHVRILYLGVRCTGTAISNQESIWIRSVSMRSLQRLRSIGSLMLPAN